MGMKDVFLIHSRKYINLEFHSIGLIVLFASLLYQKEGDYLLKLYPGDLFTPVKNPNSNFYKKNINK